MSLVSNKKIAKYLFEVADLLDLKGVQFKPRAYRRAAQNITTLSKDIKTYYENNKLEDIEGVGESIANKVKEIIENGELEYLNELRKEFPEGLQDMMKIEGLGPKSLMKLYKELGIESVGELESAAKGKKIRDIEGFGKVSEQNILESIQRYREYKERFLLGYILPIAKDIEDQLSNQEEVKRISIAGSIRRRKETIGDVDILVVSSDSNKVMDFFTNLPQVERIVSKGSTKSTIIVSENLHIDLRVIEAESFGSALQYFTGSKSHNIKLRKIALDNNWKLSEYGLIDKDTNKKIAGEDEEEIYKNLSLDFIEPELREDRGEIEAAQEGTLPDLIELEDIKGDLHVHTKWSEGSHSIEEMAEEAKKLGYEYLAICDHAKTLQIAQGMSDDEIREQMKEIEKINENLEDITILSGIEANIDSEGKLDVSSDILKDLDIVVASVHSGFKSSEEEMTNRIIDAMQNDNVNIIGHPTGRLLNKRESYDLNLTKIFEEAEEKGIFIELNAFPERLDLSDVGCMKSRDYDLLISIDTDSHNKDHLRYMELGVSTARRGWLEKKNVANSRSLKDLRELL